MRARWAAKEYKTHARPALYAGSCENGQGSKWRAVPAFSSGKSWNETSDKTGSEKKFYHNVSSGADFAEGVQVSENLGIALASQLAHAETVEAVKIGTRLPAGPGRPVLENPPVTTRTVAHRQVPLIQRVQK